MAIWPIGGVFRRIRRGEFISPTARILVGISLLSTLTGCGLIGSDDAPNSAAAGKTAVGGMYTGGGAGAAGNVGASSQMPVDNRPVAPVWQPAIPLGSPGWQQSTVPYCDTHQGKALGFGVWADQRGVFTLAAYGCAEQGDALICTGAEGFSLQFNDGTGWQWVYGDSYGTRGMMSLNGFPGGPAVLLNYGPPRGSLDATTFVQGVPSATSDAGVSVSVQPDLGDGTSSVCFRGFAVGPSHAYFVNVQTPDSSTTLAILHEYKDGVWSTVTTLPISTYRVDIWADETTVVIVGANQSIYKLDKGSTELRLIPGIPAGDYSGVWGFGPNDLWFGNTVGQLIHYDGSTWQTITVNSGVPMGQLWGAEGVLYFVGGGKFGRVIGSQVEILFSPGDAQFSISKMWGRSKNEVFLAADVSQFASYRCGEFYLLWFDGALFHQF